MFLRLLGAVAVGEDAESVTGVGGRTPEAVLAHLALAEGRTVPADTLISAVWDEPTDSARNAIQVAVAGLRRRLGPRSIDGGRDGYRLHTSLMRIDLTEAHELATDARVALDGGRPAAALASCEAAAQLFTGEPLSGLRSLRSISQRERAKELRGSLTTTRARALIDLGRFTAAIDLLREAVAERPFDEVQHELLMRALALDGNPTDALDVYEALRRRLAEELGTDPASPTTQAFTEILSGRLAPVVAKTRPYEPRVAVPTTGSPLIGRDAEVRETISRIQRGHRLVSIIGTGGIGKTRLALEVAGQITASNGSPSMFVDLTAAREPGHVRSVVSSALDVGVESIVESLAGTNTLLILDNAEHVLDAVASLAIELLSVPAVSLLVTSRTPLHLRDESVVDLDGLDSRGTESPAVQLLAERAHLSHAEEEAGLDHLQFLADRCDGIPLMLELLATSLQWRTPAEVAEEVDQILGSATDTSRDRPSRHESVTAVVEWSVLRATPDARAALGALGVIRGEFTDQAAGAVISAAVPDRQWREVLAELLDLSLVKRLRRPGQIRFRLLETVRLYLLGSEFVPPPTEAVERAHAAHYLGVLLELHGRPEGDDAFDDFVRLEDANLTPATWWMLEHDPAAAIDQLGAVAWGWYERGRHSDIRTIDTATRSRALGTPVQQAAITISALTSQTDVIDQTDSESASRLGMVSALADELDDVWHRRFVALAVQTERVNGDLPGALELTHLLRPGSARARLSGHNMRAAILAAMGDFDAALNEMRAAVGNLDGAGRTSRIFAFSNLGYSLLVTGDTAGARDAMEKALPLALEGGSALDLATIEMNLAWLELQSGQPHAALEWVRATLIGQRAHADWTAFTEALIVSATAFLSLGRERAMRETAECAVPRAFEHPELLDSFITDRANALAAATGIATTGTPPKELEDRDLLRLIDRG